MLSGNSNLILWLGKILVCSQNSDSEQLETYRAAQLRDADSVEVQILWENVPSV